MLCFICCSEREQNCHWTADDREQIKQQMTTKPPFRFGLLSVHCFSPSCA